MKLTKEKGIESSGIEFSMDLGNKSIMRCIVLAMINRPSSALTLPYVALIHLLLALASKELTLSVGVEFFRL